MKEKLQQKKQIELPVTSIKKLKKKARKNRMLVKPYMEKILIEHADQK